MNNLFSFRGGAILTALFVGMAPGTTVAQDFTAPLSTPNADRLAAEMRALASNPEDLRALISAGELSARLGDAAAAMQFFARAEKIDARNPRIAAGRGRALVVMERPGEALKYFVEAERLGLAPAEFAADRGMAYDLLGHPAHAQADYRVALARGESEEVTRRLALSLGISGNRAEAERLLTPMLRRNDRAAWRVQAMVVAMDGDFATADRIAASMLPGFGPNLSPFFRRLPALGPGDRAFAGHFGQLTRTPQRLADATMAPGVAPMAPGAVALADAGAARSAATPAPARRTRDRVQTAARSTAITRETRRGPGIAPRSPASARVAATASTPSFSPDTRPAATVPSVPMRTTSPVQLAAAASATGSATATVSTPQVSSPSQPTGVTVQAAAPARPPVALAAATPAVATVATPQASSSSAPVGAMVQAVPPPAMISSSGSAITLAGSTAAPDAGPLGARLSTSSDGVLSLTRPASSAIAPAASPAASPAFAAAAPSSTPAAAPLPAPARVGGEDDVISRIVRGISVPASELGVAAMPGSAPAPAPEPVTAEAPVPAPVERPETRAEAAPPKPAPVARPAPAKKPAAAPQPPAEPSRHWVQVAGGARAADLHKDWDRLAKQSPDAFKGKQGWTTPLRATNRLLAGPFRSPAEAQAFVNAAAKDGVSAFAWTSEAGQKIERLKR